MQDKIKQIIFDPHTKDENDVSIIYGLSEKGRIYILHNEEVEWECLADSPKEDL